MAAEPEAAARTRIDVWLWRARLTKTRALAARLAQSGHVRINGQRVVSAGRSVKSGDVLTVALERTVRVLRVAELGERRGPAAEARTLYDDLSPEPPPRAGFGGEASNPADSAEDDDG